MFQLEKSSRDSVFSKLDAKTPEQLDKKVSHFHRASRVVKPDRPRTWSFTLHNMSHGTIRCTTLGAVAIVVDISFHLIAGCPHETLKSDSHDHSHV